MMNTTCYRLVVCEKPSVARSIAAVLGAGKRGDGFLSGGGYLVSWCFGHLAELSDADAYDEKYGKWRREDLPILPDSWQYTVARDKQKQMNTLRTLMHRDDVYEVVNACDAGREVAGAVSGGADTFLSKNKAHTLSAKLQKITKYITVVFMLLVIAADVISILGK